jgi:hypothetical protein
MVPFLYNHLLNRRPDAGSTAVASILRNVFKNRRKGKDFITIISGLPRSGTSMMMKMLEAGGLSIVTDNIRKADEDNPRGYYEYERVKKIKEDSSWLDECKGKAVKMVSMLLFHLPSDKRYKVIFMRREMEEILASQRAMLRRSGQEDTEVSDDKMANNFEKHLRHTEDWMSRQDHMSVLYIHYNEALEDPATHAKLVNDFLDGWLDEKKMAEVVEVALYRKRKK